MGMYILGLNFLQRYEKLICNDHDVRILAIMLGRLRMSVHDCLNEYRKFAESMFGNPRFASTRSPLYWPQPKYDHHPFESQFESLLRRYDKSFVDEKPREVLLGSDTKQCKTYVILRTRSRIPLMYISGIS